ncbi:bifunctional aldehyde dehydrogenase/enoyl-CoA hydratase [Marinobacterium sp. xm-d-579]|uniref:MaoC family dehydratase n=1 Tax=Marinobacterium sp. xm-d-579 TaxID=2497734 RepID=UPI001569058B|nr:MaoC family dehydratase [Marinobacterium sp. xm-d-579]NRP36836.1 bifunctional aldehyde dehydrogenase/enoyl-CoA hydratase [Marinobacterium sp. xm-d-579]
MLYLEDLNAGDRFESESYEITDENIVAFAEHYDPQPFHLSDESAQDSFFESLAASGWQVGSITMRLIAKSLPIASGVIGGGVTLRWLTPTRPGDVLHVETEILEVIPSKSKPDRGVVKIHAKTINQHGETRQTFDSSLLVFRASAGVKGGIYAPK